MTENTATPPKTWSVGTLTYSAAGIVALFCWLLWGDFAWAMKERAVGSVATLMVKSFGISNLGYSLLIISFPQFTNIFLMPIISYRSDRYRSKYGRRIPFLLATTPFVVIGLIGLGFTPMLGRLLHEAIGIDKISYNMAALMVFAVFWIILDFGTTLTNAIFVALSNDVVPAKLIGRFMALFRVVSLGAAVLFNYFVLGYAEAYPLIIFVTLGFLYGFGLLTMCLKIKEGNYPPPPPAPAGGGNFFVAAKTYFKECFALPYYRWVIAAYVICTLSVLPINVYIIFYVIQLNMTMDSLGKINSFIYLGAVFLSFFLGSLADRFHPLRTGIVSIFMLTLILLAGGFFIKDTTSFTIIYAVHGIVIMSFNTLVASYGQRLFPRALFAQFNSALLMISAISTVVLAPVVGLFLDFMNSQYHYIFLIGGFIGMAGTASMIVVYRKYLKLGGDANYQAPQP
jgi:MFS family permease